MTVGVIHIAAACVSELEFHTSQRCTGQLILLLDDQLSGPFVPEGQVLGIPRLDENALGGAVQYIAVHRLDFTGNDSYSGLQILQNNFTSFIRIINTIVSTNRNASAVHNLESHTGQRFVLGSLNVLLDDQSSCGVILKGQVVISGTVAGTGSRSRTGRSGRRDSRTGIGSDSSRTGTGHHHAGLAAGHIVPGTVLYNDGLRSGIQNVAIRHLSLRHHNGTAGNQPGHRHSTIFSGGVITQNSPIAVLHCKNRSGNRLSGYRVQLGNGQAAQRFIVDRNILRLPRSHNYGFRFGIQVIPVRCPHLCYHISIGIQLGQHDLAVCIGGIDAVTGSLSFVVRDIFTTGSRDLEFSTGHRSTGHTVVLGNDQVPLGGVGDHYSLYLAVIPHYHIGGGRIHHITNRGLDFRDYIGSGIKIGNTNLTAVVCGENPVLT